MKQNQKNTAQFSVNSRDYLSEFHHILHHMIEGMTDVTLADSISYNFIIQMIPHHEAAIQMSQNLLRYTTWIPLQDIAQQIIKEQTKSIEQMREIQYCCKNLTDAKETVCRYQKRVDEVTHIMFDNMKNAAAVNNINTSFLHEMIPHHLGAIRMSENALRYEICPELVPILQAILASQKRGVMQMRQLLRHRIQC